ncbi:hypothetical protein WDU94_006580 [Cyamophila willieti]
MIPDFNGEVALLPEFITVCDSVVKYFWDKDSSNSFQNFFLLNSLKAKIKGNAKLNISSYAINSWAELKDALLNTYGDKRDCYTLTIELCNMKQNNESAFNFHARIQQHINLHASYLATHAVDGAADVTTYIGKLGLRTFLKGLKEPLGSLMRTKDPKSLNDALSVLTNEFQNDANTNATATTRTETLVYTNPTHKQTTLDPTIRTVMCLQCSDNKVEITSLATKIDRTTIHPENSTTSTMVATANGDKPMANKTYGPSL